MTAGTGAEKLNLARYPVTFSGPALGPRRREPVSPEVVAKCGNSRGLHHQLRARHPSRITPVLTDGSIEPIWFPMLPALFQRLLALEIVDIARVRCERLRYTIDLDFGVGAANS